MPVRSAAILELRAQAGSTVGGWWLCATSAVECAPADYERAASDAQIVAVMKVAQHSGSVLTLRLEPVGYKVKVKTSE